MARIEIKTKPLEDSPPYRRLQKIKARKLRRQGNNDYLDNNYRQPKRQSKFYCCCFYIILLLVLCLLATAVIAKTGLIRIPIISNFFYKTPQPIRLVKSTPSIISAKELLQNYSISKDNKEISIEISEQQLTSLINQAINISNEIKVKELQVAIENEKIEIFGHLQTPVDAYLTIDFLPVLNENELTFDIITVKLGVLPLPTGMSEWLVYKLLNQPLEKFNQSILAVGTINNIKTEDKYLIINAKLNQ